MQQTSDEIERARLERLIHNQIDTLRRELEPRVTLLEAPAFDSPNFQTPYNYIPNSMPEWSTTAWTTAGTSAGTVSDGNRSCYNWYEGTAATTDLGTMASLVSSGHSTYAGLGADEAIWDRVNGNFNLGSSTTNYDIASPLSTDFVFPGQTYYVYFEAAKTQTDTNDNGTEFYCGFWDNTAGQRKWIEGSDFTPTISVYGSSGARTLEYKILAETDSGDQILSVAVSTAVAPAALTASNHIRLSFHGAPGFIRYVIYRKDGANYYRVGEIRNSIDLQFFDLQESGSSVVSVGGYPTASGNRPRAYATTNSFAPAELGSFAAHTMAIQVPLTYNRSNTGNLQQWFRFGLTGLVAAGSEREIAIRRLMVSEGYGAWTRSALDLQAKSSPSTAATSGPTSGGTTGDPPTGGGGGRDCLPYEVVVPTLDGDKTVGELQRGDYVVVGLMALPIKRIRDGEVSYLLEIELETGETVRCSSSHKWITSLKDRKGISTSRLKEGDKLLTRENKESRIIRITEIPGQAKVRQIYLPYPHIFIANGIVSHNVKPVEIEL